MPPVKVEDDRGRKLFFIEAPQRVVSLVPSDTYSIARLGAAERLVGRTRYCVLPEDEIANVEIVGGTKDADVDRIVALAPDLVIANREENSQRDVERLEQAGIAVLLSFPRTVAAGLAHLARLARVLGFERQKESRARAVVESGYRALRESEARSNEPLVRVFVPIWMDPLMTANDDTFLASALALAGAKNVFGDRERRYPLAADLGRFAGLPPEKIVGRDTRYPRVTLDEVRERAPDLVLLPDEPYAFTEADADVFRAVSPSLRVQGCDGKDLMWYGARSLEGLDRVAALVDLARGTPQRAR